MQHLLQAISHDQDAMNRFVSVISGAVPPTEFFSGDNVARILAGVPEPA
jgi:hypothetical protein